VGNGSHRSRRIARIAALIVVLAGAAFVTTASADTTVTYTATQTIPVPPASNYAGTGGGDGWAVALTPTSVYNVFHHSAFLDLACHLQSNAQQCWDSGSIRIRDAANGFDFSVSGQPGLFLDHGNGHLYLFATRWDNARRDVRLPSVGGVVCVDTNVASPSTDPFCGFTALTAPDEVVGTSTTSGISDPAIVGSKMYAFNYVSGSGITGTKNKLLCFDTATQGACDGQPYSVDLAIGGGTVSASNFPAPSIAAIAGRVVVPAAANSHNVLGCLDTATLGKCDGAWPIVDVSYFPSSNGAPFPMLSTSGSAIGFCLPTGTDPCYGLDGSSVSTPPGMTNEIFGTSGWNGPAVVVGPRVYVPNGNRNEIDCYDYNLGGTCGTNPNGGDIFPRHVSGLSLLYTVNSDPQRPDCLWVNADSGTQIQNFDAFTGGACGQGAIRVLASSFVVDTPLCTPGSWTSLQITSPTRDTYTSGSVQFVDGSGVQIPNAAPRSIDASGTVDLTGLDLATRSGLPQFLITLDGAGGKPQSVTVKVTWQGAFDPSCATKPGTEIVNPPTNTPSAPSAPAQADVRVSITGPSFVRAGSKATFIATVLNAGPDTATGVSLKAPTIPGATFNSASSTVGNGCLGQVCEIGTLTNGQSAVVTLVYTANQTGTMVFSPTVESDHDPNQSNNTASKSTPVIAVGAPPPAPPIPTQSGTFNAIGTGTVTINGKLINPDQLLTVNSGDDVDVTDGSLTIATSDGSVGTFSSSQPTARRQTSSTARSTANLHAEFIVSQPASGGLTTLTLAGASFDACGTPRKLSATNQTPVRQLWGSAKGNFSTKGRFAAATVRGTIWLVQDRCDGTLAQVVQGLVDVLDTTKNTTVSVAAGQNYVALAPAGTFKPPAATKKQTAAQVKARGLRWANKTFLTKTAFTTYLRSHGSTWVQFSKNYPVLAKALASRKK
jgi:uncharacterized repeat protein (TIGR01451 family)